MALTLGSSLLFTASLLVAACALFWPQLETLYLQSHHAAVNRTGSAGTKCPLGYEGPMPADHPPTGKQQQQWQKQSQQGVGPVLAGATSLPTPAAAAAAASIAGTVNGPQHVFVNSHIWTANPQVPWASIMSVDTATGVITHLDGTPSSSSCTPAGSSSSSSPAAAGAAAASGSCSAAAADDTATGAAAGFPAGSTVVDLQGAFVMPGFVDPHVHLIFGGLSLSQVNLRGASSRQEVAARVAAAAAAAEDGAWLLGGGWSESDWGGQLPDASWLDEAAGSHPVFLTRMDYHMALVNSAALQQAGLADSAGSGCGCSCDPGNDAGGVDRDAATGQPTGLLREHAMDLVRRLIPSPSVQQRKAALAAASSHLLSRGVTSVGDMGWGVFGDGEEAWLDLEKVYDAAAAAGKLPIRVSSYVPLRTWRRAAERLAANGTHHASGRLLWGGVKEFADGSLGSSTAVFWRPYADDPSGSNTGMRLIELGDLQQLVHGAAGAGLQTAVHAIGDRAVDEVLEVFEQVEECTEGEADHQQQQHRKCMQHRVEHVQHISSSVTAAKLAVLGLHAVPNPQHLISDRALLVRKLGQERAGAGRTHAYRTLATMGVSMGFASDWPVVEVDPFASVYASVFRKAPPAVKGQSAATHDGSSSGGVSDGGSAPIPQPPPMPEEQAWAPEESMPLEVALQLHTATAAKVARLDQWAGELRPGLRGDFIVLDRSPFEGMDEYGGGGFGAGLPQVVKTYVDGRCVYGCDGGDVAGSGLAVADSEGVSR